MKNAIVTPAQSILSFGSPSIANRRPGEGRGPGQGVSQAEPRFPWIPAFVGMTMGLKLASVGRCPA